jgi:hypothetical protein
VNRTDTTTRRVTTGIVLAVGSFAGGDSYAHIFSLARTHGQDVISAALLPLAGDGLIAAASSVMLVATRQGKDVPLRARVMLLAGIVATIAANLAYGLPHGRTDALLSVWPVLAYVGCMELLAWMRAHTGMQPARRAVATVAASPDADAPRATVTSIRQPRAGDLLARAEAAFPDALKDGKLPTLRDIQGALKVGQPRAQTVQAHFTSLRETALGR